MKGSMKKPFISLFLIASISVYSQTESRQESSYPLKKVVYSGDLTQFPLVTNTYYDNGHTFYGIYSAIPIPEINLTNMPLVNVWVWPLQASLQPPPGWVPANYQGGLSVLLTNGTCYLNSGYNGNTNNASFTKFMIVVTYEDVPTNSTPQQIPPLGFIQTALTNSGNNGACLSLEFTTETNNFYYIQDSTNLSSWETLDGPFLGNGNLFLKAYPVTNQDKMFYRFSQTSLEAW